MTDTRRATVPAHEEHRAPHGTGIVLVVTLGLGFLLGLLLGVWL